MMSLSWRLLAIVTVTASSLVADDSLGLKEGACDLKSAGALAFGPPGILFVADPLGAQVFALDTGDRSPAPAAHEIKLEAIDEKIAALLGTKTQDIAINDMVVNPVSGKAYLSVSRGLGPNPQPVILRVTGPAELTAVGLEKIRFSRAALVDAPAAAPAGDAGKEKGRGRGNQRLESITDIAFIEDRLLVAGLSNEEFASSLRTLDFPFKNVAKGTGVEIYHGAHGKLETHSPVRTFVPFKIGSEAHLFAAYTCTPLVTFPLSKLTPGAKLTGKTVAELGNRNRPLDMVVYRKDGKDFLLIANSSRGVMKVATENVEKADAINSRVDGIKGLPYETVSDWKGIDQLDRLDDKHVLVVRRSDAGPIHLETRAFP